MLSQGHSESEQWSKCARVRGCQSELSCRRALVVKANSSMAVALAPTFVKFKGDPPGPPHVSSSTKVPLKALRMRALPSKCATSGCRVRPSRAHCGAHERAHRDQWLRNRVK